MSVTRDPRIDEALARQIIREGELHDAIEFHLGEAIKAALELFDEDYAYQYLIGQIQMQRPKRERSPEYRKKTVSTTLRKQVYERDEYRCKQCNTHLDLTIDHIIPEIKGGKTIVDNLQTLCRSCNSTKGPRI